jgi:hypothetical protein
MLMLMKCNALKEAKHLRCYKNLPITGGYSYEVIMIYIIIVGFKSTNCHSAHSDGVCLE